VYGQPVALTCPNCGAGFGPLQGGQYVCGYCGHRSVPPRPPVNPAQYAASLAASLASFESRRASGASRMDEIRQRERDAQSAQRITSSYVLLGIGILFLGIAVACFVSAAMTLAGGDSAGASGPFGFGWFWVVFGGGMLYGGVRYARAERRDKRLRAQGLRGRAVVLSYREHNIALNGSPRMDLVLQVELPGVAPYVVKMSEWVDDPFVVTTGNELPIFVDPQRATDVMVDWIAAQ
jgi:hypothetical protein